MNVDESKLAYSITRLVENSDDAPVHGHNYTPFLCDKAPKIPLMLGPHISESKVVIGTLNTDLSITDNIQIKFNKPNSINVSHVFPLQNSKSYSIILIFWYNNNNMVLKINTSTQPPNYFNISKLMLQLL